MKETKKTKIKIVLGLFGFMIVAILLECIILNFANKMQTYKTSSLLLDQVETILSENSESEQELLKQLKEDYINTAVSIAYNLNYNEEAKTDAEELQKIAKMMKVDEIHLFDENGVIFSGTNPEYYGMSMDDGEQIGYFKPMLKFKHLTMCQDVTPNTADARRMMYAITWDSTGTYMLQIGVEPVRLIKEMNRNSIREIVKKMPAYDGTDIYIADASDGEILGATDTASIGKSVYDVKLANQNEDLSNLSQKTLSIDGYRCYSNTSQYNDYIIATVSTTKANFTNFLIAIAIEIVWILVSVVIIAAIFFRLINARSKIEEQIRLVHSMSDIYYTVYYLNLEDYSFEVLEQNEAAREIEIKDSNAKEMLDEVINTFVDDIYRQSTLEFANMDTLAERLKKNKAISVDIVDKRVGWVRISIIAAEYDSLGNPTRAIMASMDINADKKREQELSLEANRDILTGLRNRRSYEKYIQEGPISPDEKDFVYIAIDINGLKKANDEIGHAAGDELIKAAATCLKRAFDDHGKVYRTGGDEFVAMILADNEKLEKDLALLTEVSENWKGEFINGVFLAVGCAKRSEFPESSVTELAKIADKRMYEAKDAYYAKTGIERRKV